MGRGDDALVVQDAGGCGSVAALRRGWEEWIGWSLGGMWHAGKDGCRGKVGSGGWRVECGYGAILMTCWLGANERGDAAVVEGAVAHTWTGERDETTREYVQGRRRGTERESRRCDETLVYRVMGQGRQAGRQAAAVRQIVLCKRAVTLTMLQ